MTLKRKILISILSLTVLIILAMSGTYYGVFSQQMKDSSYVQVENAFTVIFDDLHTRAQDLVSQADRFMQSTLTGPAYVLRLRKEQYTQGDAPWTMREVRTLMPSISTIANEIRKFGEFTGASEISVYDHQKQLVAIYRRNDQATIVGSYLPDVVQDALLPIEPEDDWFATLRNLEDIPQISLPDGTVLSYQQEVPSETVVELRQQGNTLFLTITAPMIQKKDLGGICVIQLALSQKDMERYSRLSGTQVNIFAESTYSAGTLPAYATLPEIDSEDLSSLNMMALNKHSAVRFSETDVDGEGYYQGLVAFGEAPDIVAVMTVHLSRQKETESRQFFLMVSIIITLVFGGIAVGGALFLSGVIARPIKRLTTLLHQLTIGDLEGISGQLSLMMRSSKAPRDQRVMKDEFALLFRSFHAMVEYLLDMVNVAEHISRGEIAQEVTPRSEQDRLGNAFARMTRYLNTIAAAAAAVADGDLRQDIQPQTDGDVLGHAFHELHALRTTMRDIMQEANQLKTMSQELQEISTQMAADAQQSSQRTQDVSSISQQLNQNVSEVSIATSQMSASIQEISHTAHDVASVVDTAVGTAGSANTTIADLEVRSQEIGNIIKLITVITQQTNILALNATIEAARAGDMGRGFAVVASEVKNLAREITASAENITSQVGAIQTSSHNATEAINLMGDEIERIYTATSVIVAAVTEQASTTNVITQNLTDAANATKAVTQAINDVAHVAQNSSELALKVQQSAEKQSLLAEQLQQLVSTFKI